VSRSVVCLSKKEEAFMSDHKHVFLRNFKTSELVFDEDETKDILRFFFKNDHDFIDSITIDDKIRNFAQGILIEAINASYAIGYVKIIFDVFYMQPPKPMKKILKKLAKKASMHWFNKHVRTTDLHNIKIYEMVRGKVADNFRWHFMNLANGLVMKKPAVAVYAYTMNKSRQIIWS
jgi:hypothetical protein